VEGSLPLVQGGEGAVLEGVLPFVCRLSTALESAVRVLRICRRSALLEVVPSWAGALP